MYFVVGEILIRKIAVTDCCKYIVVHGGQATVFM